MLLGEEQRLGKTDFSTLLNNENFNRSLIVCSIETILFAYNCKDTLIFKDLLKLFELQPFDFCKIIESFILHNSWVRTMKVFFCFKISFFRCQVLIRDILER